MRPSAPLPRRRGPVQALAPALASAALLLAGCQTPYPLPHVDVTEPTSAIPLAVAAAGPGAAPVAPAAPGQPAAAAAVPANGAIFRPDSYRPLFENHRARIVGDSLTVQITEKLSATQSATSNIDRSGKVSAGITALPFLKGSALTRATAEGTDANTFAGKGTTQASNDFSGTLTVTVVQVLPNGNLVVSGEKQIGVNANVDVLRFSGVVDPRAITPGNQVLSTQVADVRIQQRGRGQQAEAQAMGWLSRFFLNVLPI